MSEEQWLEAQRDLMWAEALLDDVLRRSLRNIALDFVDASVTLKLPDFWSFRTTDSRDVS